MRRAAILGGDDLRAAAAALDLAIDADAPEVALVDADDDARVRESEDLPAGVPRVFVAGGTRAALLRAAGATRVLSRPLDAAALGPLVFALERERRRAPRVLMACAASGATGRTMLVTNLALRLARDLAVVAIDATGTGALAWRLGAEVAPWADLEAVGPDLGEAHVRLAAAERDRVLVLGGHGRPDDAILERVVTTASAVGVVLVDAPASRPPPGVAALSDRLIVCANPDPASAAATRALLDAHDDRTVDLVVSQAAERDAAVLAALFGRAPTYLLPRDERACHAALASRGATGGALGRAYDALAEILLAELRP